MLRSRVNLWAPTAAAIACATLPAVVRACPDCAAGQQARAAITADPNFWTYVAVMLLPFALIGVITAIRRGPQPDRPVVVSGTLLGVGLGGFVDGITLHQILQWHNMLSSKLVPDDLVKMKINMLWDGLFHGFTWLMTVIGIAILWRAGRRPEVPWVTRSFVGAMLFGWGLFNLIEGLVDHQILGLHHVHPGSCEFAWDMGFLASGALMIAVGRGLIYSGRRRP
jgi:uncharacterized membrane protein